MTAEGSEVAEGSPVTIAYGDSDEEVADLYLPAGEGPFPVVVLIHGGFWREQFKRDLMEPLAYDLVARGYAAWNLEYHRVGGGGGWPTTFDDVARGIDHLADLPAAQRDLLDLDRVVSIGHSAGGHLSLWAASRPTLPADAPGAAPQVTLCAAVSQAGVTDLAFAARAGVGGSAVEDLLGAPPEQIPDIVTLASPIERLPLGIPQLLVHGDGDGNVPLDQSQRYAVAATDAGDDADLVVTGDDHFTMIDPTGEGWREITDRLGTLCDA